MSTPAPAPDAYAGQADSQFAMPKSVRTNPLNYAPADRADYNPLDAKWAGVPGAGARRAGYPRLS